MLCVVISSSTFNFLSNKFGWATSSTHALIGALIGVGVASGAGVQWGYVVTTSKTTGEVTGQNGLGAVVASFLISPALAGCIGAITFTLVRLIVLERGGNRSFRWAIYSVPVWYGVVAAFEAFLISWKSPRYKTINDDTGATLAIFFATLGGVTLLTALFLVPYFYRSVWNGWQLKLWHLPLMPLTNAMLIRLLPGIDTPHPHFDARHLTGEAIPDDEAWQWHPEDMAVLHFKKVNAGKLAAIEAGAAGAEADASTPKSADSADAKAATMAVIAKQTQDETELARLELGGRPTLLDEKGVALSAWKQRQAYIKIDLKDPALPWHTKIYRLWIFLFFIGTDREIANYKVDTEESE